MNNKVKITGLLIIALLLAFWFIYRPYSIRIACFELAVEESSQGVDLYERSLIYNSMYQSCVNSRGLDK